MRVTRPSPPATTELLKAAILIAGSEAKLGKAAGYSQNAIWAAKRAGRVSAELAAGIDRATNGAISRFRLRPDVFGAAAPLAPADRPLEASGASA